MKLIAILGDNKNNDAVHVRVYTMKIYSIWVSLPAVHVCHSRYDTAVHKCDRFQVSRKLVSYSYMHCT